MIAKTSCQHCGIHIEFEAENAGTTAPCPSCGQQTTLLLPSKPATVQPAPVKTNQNSRSILIIVGTVAGIMVVCLIGFGLSRISRKQPAESEIKITAVQSNSPVIPKEEPQTAEQKAKPDVTKHIKVLGDETHVSSIIASPRNYMYKTIVVVGGVETDNYYNFRYSEDSHSYYSLRFQESTKDMKPLGKLAVYASREFSKPLIDALLENEAKGSGKLVRLKIQITSKSFAEDNSYSENAELLDWQLINPSHDTWSSWAMEGAAIEAGKAWAEQAAINRVAQGKAQAEAKAKAAAQKQATATRVLKANQDAAAKGDMFGLLRMGERYRDGDGVEKDLAKAKEYLQKAADAGSPTAAEELSKLKQ